MSGEGSWSREGLVLTRVWWAWHLPGYVGTGCLAGGGKEAWGSCRGEDLDLVGVWFLPCFKRDHGVRVGGRILVPWGPGSYQVTVGLALAR